MLKLTRSIQQQSELCYQHQTTEYSIKRGHELSFLKRNAKVGQRDYIKEEKSCTYTEHRKQIY